MEVRWVRATDRCGPHGRPLLVCSGQARGGHAVVYQQLVEAEIPDVIGAGESGEGSGEDGGAVVAPGAIGSGEAIAGIACDDELMALLGVG